MDRVWFLTWTTYGTWLPGEDRGHVSNIRNSDGRTLRLNTPGTEPAARQRGLQLAARAKMVGEPIYLNTDHAATLLAQFLETATYRGWTPLAIAIMANHVHLLVGVTGDPEPGTILRDFKSYGSRALNRAFGQPPSGTWWTEGGSTRKKATDDAVHAANEYVENQEHPLVVWLQEHSERWT